MPIGKINSFLGFFNSKYSIHFLKIRSIGSIAVCDYRQHNVRVSRNRVRALLAVITYELRANKEVDLYNFHSGGLANIISETLH